MSAKIRKPIPNRPFYISDSDEVNGDWAINFDTGVQAVGLGYGIPQAQLDQVKAAALVIAAFMGRLSRAKAYYEECITCKNSYFNTDPNFPQGPVKFAKLSEEKEAPAPLPPNILKIFIEVAEAILLKGPTEADRNLLGLVTAKGKLVPPGQKPRPKAADAKYPQLKYGINGNTITISVKRGDVFKGKMLRLIVDKEGRGQYLEAGITNTSSYVIVFTLPAGVQAGVWVFKGVFMEGQKAIGDWSPELVVPLTKPVEPGVGESLATALATVNAAAPVANGEEAVMA